jgi:hypothetical protein
LSFLPLYTRFVGRVCNADPSPEELTAIALSKSFTIMKLYTS